MTVDVALDCQCELGEGPIWDHRSALLLFVDIDGHRIHWFDPASEKSGAHDAGEYVSAVALAPDDRYLVTLQHDIAVFDRNARTLTRLAAVERDRPDTRFNDGYVDPRGRFWAGTMSLRREPQQGALYRLDSPGARATRVLADVTTSNGIDWTSDSRRMYYVDTGTRRIDMFDYDAESAAIANRRPFVEIRPEHGKPDGLILDEEDFVWVALWQGRAVRRYAPDGRLVQQIDLPVTCPTKCAFGGAHLDELYITTARTILTDEGRAREPHAGSLFVCRPGARGKRARPVA